MPPFTLQRQRPNECLLASLCIYLGKDYNVASKAFEVQYGYAWGDYKRKPLADHILNVKGFCAHTFNIDLPMQYVRADYLLAMDPPKRLVPSVWLKGGILVMGVSLGSSYMRAYHAVAFDAATQNVYDSSAVEVISLPEYIRNYNAMLIGGWTHDI